MTNFKFQLRNVAAIAACLAVTMFASCKKDTPDLNGTVTISPTANVFTGTELTAAYSGSEKITWQWNKGGTAIGGATNDKYTPTEAGNYTVTANAAGYNSKTSAAVEVKAIQNLNGTVTISPPANAFIGDELTATYSGSETVSWQWNKSGTAIDGATANKYKPSEAGSYTVTASATGYNSKTSTAVEVKAPIFLLEEILEGNGRRTVFEYDDKDRILKISYYRFDGSADWVFTLIYDPITSDLVEIKGYDAQNPEDTDNETYIKNGNKITWGRGEIELAQGLPVKFTMEGEGTSIFTWENGNITKEEWEGWIGNYIYDDNKSPFYHCKTPKWFLLRWLGFTYCSVNNIKTVTSGGSNSTYKYTYNNDGFPVERTDPWDETCTYKYKKR